MVRDVYQRKIYALMRMNLAVARMKKATNEMDRAKALAWLNAWLSASGLRRFKLESRHRKTQAPTCGSEMAVEIWPGSVLASSRRSGR
jgi:hypothetical protein